jgi:hypothetical protein
MQKFLFLLSLTIAPVLLTTAAAGAHSMYGVMESHSYVSDKTGGLEDPALQQAIQLIQPKTNPTPGRHSLPRQRQHSPNLITGGSEAFPM